MSRADAYAKVMQAVLDDHDRSIERTIAHGLNAGIELERQRVRAILELPTPVGLEKAVIAMIVHGAAPEHVAE